MFVWKMSKHHNLCDYTEQFPWTWVFTHTLSWHILRDGSSWEQTATGKNSIKDTDAPIHTRGHRRPKLRLHHHPRDDCFIIPALKETKWQVALQHLQCTPRDAWHFNLQWNYPSISLLLSADVQQFSFQSRIWNYRHGLYLFILFAIPILYLW